MKKKYLFVIVMALVVIVTVPFVVKSFIEKHRRTEGFDDPTVTEEIENNGYARTDGRTGSDAGRNAERGRTRTRNGNTRSGNSCSGDPCARYAQTYGKHESAGDKC